jgi:hypothetical protein
MSSVITFKQLTTSLASWVTVALQNYSGLFVLADLQPPPLPPVILNGMARNIEVSPFELSFPGENKAYYSNMPFRIRLWIFFLFSINRI